MIPPNNFFFHEVDVCSWEFHNSPTSYQMTRWRISTGHDPCCGHRYCMLLREKRGLVYSHNFNAIIILLLLLKLKRKYAICKILINFINIVHFLLLSNYLKAHVWILEAEKQMCRVVSNHNIHPSFWLMSSKCPIQ